MFPPSFLSRHVRQISSAAVFTDAGDAAIEKEVNALSESPINSARRHGACDSPGPPPGRLTLFMLFMQ